MRDDQAIVGIEQGCCHGEERARRAHADQDLIGVNPAVAGNAVSQTRVATMITVGKEQAIQIDPKIAEPRRRKRRAQAIPMDQGFQ